jgi:hypothetical protein
MFSSKLRFGAAVVLGLGVTGMGFALGQSHGVARHSSRASANGNASTAPARLSASARLIYRYVKLGHPGEYNWERVPWLVDLTEAIQQAKAEDRPLLLWTTDDDPLERC